MSAPSSGNPLWQAHLERLRRLHASIAPAQRRKRPRRPPLSPEEAEGVRHGEWTASPPGRLGRRLVAEIEPYLAFFAVAREA